jgi:hypothetical protein
LRLPRDTLYPQKLALTSTTSGYRSIGRVRLRTTGHGDITVPEILHMGLVFSQDHTQGLAHTQRSSDAVCHSRVCSRQSIIILSKLALCFDTQRRELATYAACEVNCHELLRDTILTLCVMNTSVAFIRGFIRIEVLWISSSAQLIA